MNASRPSLIPIPEGAEVPGRCSVPLVSSLLASVAYDAERAVLQLELRSGAVYQYLKVPLQIYQDLLQAGSHGVYFNRHIRGLYPYTVCRRA